MLLSGICKYAYFTRIHAGKYIFIFIVRRFLITVVDRHINGLGVAEAIHQEHDRHFLDLLLFIYDSFRILDGCPSGTGISLFDGIHLPENHAGHAGMIFQNILILRDVLQSLLIFLHQSLDLQTNQSVQTHLQDSLGLALGEPKLGRTLFRCLGFKTDAVSDTRGQTGLGVLDILTAPQDLDDQVNDLAGFDEAFLNFPLLLLFRQQCPIFPGGQLVLEFDVMLQNLAEA